uniref:Uncharacterized protein n=1 Tax=Rhizophora mucronata TaxID=61149 RepID=A0A2P2KGU5_RHIMU
MLLIWEQEGLLNSQDLWILQVKWNNVQHSSGKEVPSSHHPTAKCSVAALTTPLNFFLSEVSSQNKIFLNCA